MSEKKWAVVMNQFDLEFLAQALHDVRLPCPEVDCFTCSHYAELERRVRHAMSLDQ